MYGNDDDDDNGGDDDDGGGGGNEDDDRWCGNGIGVDAMMVMITGDVDEHR